MFVGCLEVTLSIPEAQSLKDKRSVVRRSIDRARNKFNISVSEVGDNDEWQRARIGVSCVANDHSFVNSVLDKVLDQIEHDSVGYAHVIDQRLEIVTF
jgi:uncharacterized protein YlxP (DUF503 family)